MGVQVLNIPLVQVVGREGEAQRHMLGLDGGAQLHIERQRGAVAGQVGLHHVARVFEHHAHRKVLGRGLVEHPRIGGQAQGAVARNARNRQLAGKAKREFALRVRVGRRQGVLVHRKRTQRVARRVEALQAAVVKVRKTQPEAPAFLGSEGVGGRALLNVAHVGHVAGPPPRRPCRH